MTKDEKIKKLELKIAELEGALNAYKEANKILADRICNYNIMPPIRTNANCNQPTLNRMTDLQKQIEELNFLSAQLLDKNLSDVEYWLIKGETETAQKALSVIKQLQEENKAYIECLRRINSCDDSATQQSREAHQVLKQFGKL